MLHIEILFFFFQSHYLKFVTIKILQRKALFLANFTQINWIITGHEAYIYIYFFFWRNNTHFLEFFVIFYENFVKCKIHEVVLPILSWYPPNYVFIDLCLFVCLQNNSKSSAWISLKFSHNLRMMSIYRWFNFSNDPVSGLDPGRL